MSPLPLYPLRFAPIYQYRLWGGRRLANLLGTTPADDGPIGEAWVLSGREDHPSRVTNGPLEGHTLSQLMEQAPSELLGRLAQSCRRFPLLLKFLDARDMLSVQVHPSDLHTDLLPAGESGKTEAWVVLEADPAARIYAGLAPGITAGDLQRAIASRTVPNALASFVPSVGDGVFVPAGTVHALGGGVVVFEVQQNSDVTFRLYDWDRVDAKTGQARTLHIPQALACIDLAQGAVSAVEPVVEATAPVSRERLFRCEQFTLWRLRGDSPFSVGAEGAARVLVCLDGAGRVEQEGTTHPVGKGEVWLLPAAVGECVFRPLGTVTLLEVALPEAG